MYGFQNPVATNFAWLSVLVNDHTGNMGGIRSICRGHAMATVRRPVSAEFYFCSVLVEPRKPQGVRYPEATGLPDDLKSRVQSLFPLSDIVNFQGSLFMKVVRG